MKSTASGEVELDGPARLQAALPLASEGVARWVWHGRFGTMLIEAVGQSVRVNGVPVEPYRSDGEQGGSIRN